MHLLLLEGYTRIYAVDSFFDDFKKLFGKDARSYELEKKHLLSSLKLLDQQPLPELIKMGKRFERLVNEDFYVIRHVSKTNPRSIFIIADDDGNLCLLNCFLEKSPADYEVAKQKAKGIQKLLF